MKEGVGCAERVFFFTVEVVVGFHSHHYLVGAVLRLQSERERPCRFCELLFKNNPLKRVLVEAER